jgi:hypothetical protein
VLQASREMATRSLSSVRGAFGGLPAELRLAVQCLRQETVRGRLKRVVPGHHVTSKRLAAHLEGKGGICASSRPVAILRLDIKPWDRSPTAGYLEAHPGDLTGARPKHFLGLEVLTDGLQGPAATCQRSGTGSIAQQQPSPPPA